MCFLTHDEKEHGKSLSGMPVIGPPEWLLENDRVAAICAIGNPRSRIAVVSPLEDAGVEFVSVIHPSVSMSEFVDVASGCVICAGTVITTQVALERHVFINLNVTIGHDTQIEPFVTIAPGVNVSGGVRLAYGAQVGTNATIVQGLRIGRGAMVGAGAMVLQDVDDNVVVVSRQPAAKLRKQEEPL